MKIATTLAAVSVTALFSLSACESAVVYKPEEVKEPISTPCHVLPPTSPDWNIPHIQPTAKLTDKLRAVLADLELSKGYNEELLAVVKACAA